MRLAVVSLTIFILLLHFVVSQEEKEVSSSFKKSIDNFIEKISVLKKNMKKLAAEREKLKAKENPEDKKDKSTNELDSDEYEVSEDFDFYDEEDTRNIEENEQDDLSLEDVLSSFEQDEKLSNAEEEENEDIFDFSDEVDNIEDSLQSESSFLDNLLNKLSKKDKAEREEKSKLKDFIARTKNRKFLTGLREKSLRAREEQTRLSGFLNRFRTSQANLERPRFRQDPLRSFRNILGVPPSRSEAVHLIEENRSLLSVPDEKQQSRSERVNEAFALLNGVPRVKGNDGNVFVFTFADSNNPVLVFDG